MNPIIPAGARRVAVFAEGHWTLYELPSADGASFLFDKRPLQLDEKAGALLNDEARAHLALAHSALAAVQNWEHDALDVAVREVAERNSLKLGKLAQPLRAALTGKTTSPGIFDVLVLMGKDESLARIADQMLEPNP